jgi:hypothetical protein
MSVIHLPSTGRRPSNQDLTDALQKAMESTQVVQTIAEFFAKTGEHEAASKMCEGISKMCDGFKIISQQIEKVIKLSV